MNIFVAFFFTLNILHAVGKLYVLFHMLSQTAACRSPVCGILPVNFLRLLLSRVTLFEEEVLCKYCRRFPCVESGGRSCNATQLRDITRPYSLNTHRFVDWDCAE